ncbi:MAG: hypothetical protein HY903_13030 [Deltaproteobacteria bacterium]|nr:hypothetical protein [Deltaproteobacteria bacterium]
MGSGLALVWLAPLFIAQSTVGAGGAASASDGASCPEVPHLVLDVGLSADHVLSGTAVWTITNTEAAPLAQLQLALLANGGEEPNPSLSGIANAAAYFNAWEPAKTDLQTVEVDGHKAPFHYLPSVAVNQRYSLQRIYAVVPLAAPLAPGGCVRLETHFATTVPHQRGDGGHFNGDTTWRFGWFPQPRVRMNGQWQDGVVFSGFTHVTRFAVEDQKTVILGADRVRYDADAAYARSDVVVRSIPFVVSDRLTRTSRTIDGVRVHVYTYPDLALFDTSEGEARETLAELSRILPFYRKAFGAYRLHTLQVLESPLSWASMAADGMILQSDVFFIYDRSWIAWGLFRPLAAVILAHELGHQWWGVGVGADMDAENWLSESLSQFMAYSYSEARFGTEGNDYLRPNWFIRALAANFGGTALPQNQLNHEIQPSYTDHLRFGVDGSILAPMRSRAHPEESAYLVYNKGYLAVRALAGLLSPSGLRATLRALFAERAGSIITTDDLAATALAVTGVDIQPFLHSFVRGTAHADLSVTAVESVAHRGGVRTRITLHRDGDLTLPATVRIDTGERSEDVVWDTREPDRVVEVESDAAPQAVSVDPDNYVPDSNRGNNVWPEKTRFEMFAPQRNPDATTYSFNPLPIHRHYLAGLSVGGVDYDNNRFWVGAGVANVLGDAKREGKTTYAVESKVYGEAAVPSGRAAQLSALAESTYRRDWDNGDYAAARLTLAHTAALYQPIDVGYTGAWSLPRTTLSSRVGVGGVSIPGRPSVWSDRHLKSPDRIHEGAVPFCGLTLVRDETLNYGAAFEIALALGLDRSLDRAFGVAESAVTTLHVIPYLGRLSLFAHGFVASAAADPLFARPGMRALPYTRTAGINPFDAGADAGVLLKVPVLRDLRIKNELTLGLLVLNDVSLEAHYGIATGSEWRGARDDGLGPWERVGEAGVAVRIGLGFLAFPFELAIGIGTPVWPSKSSFEERGYFIRAGT